MLCTKLLVSSKFKYWFLKLSGIFFFQLFSTHDWLNLKIWNLRIQRADCTSETAKSSVIKSQGRSLLGLFKSQAYPWITGMESGHSKQEVRVRPGSKKNHKGMIIVSEEQGIWVPHQAHVLHRCVHRYCTGGTGPQNTWFWKLQGICPGKSQNWKEWKTCP